MTTKRETRIAFAIVRVASLLVPRLHRADWTLEWRAELKSRASEGRSVAGTAFGSFSHGAWLFWEDIGLHTESAARDLGYAARTLRRRPLFALSAVITLALGLGATTVVYTIVNGVLLAPLPYPGAERFVKIETRWVEWDTRISTLSVELFTEWRERAPGFEAFESYVRSHDAHFVGAGPPAIVEEVRVSPGFLPDLLGVHAVLGRMFDEAEALGEGERVALISEGFWQERFGGRPDAVGTIVHIDGRETAIIGVLPSVELLPDVEVWTPLLLVVDHSRSVSGALNAIARLAPGVTPAAALSSLEAAHAEALRVHPRSMAPFAPEIRDYRSALVEDVDTHLLLLMGAVAVVLLLACANVTNLFLSRNAERTHELAIRTSLGAGRRHLISQVFVEGLFVAAVGGVAGGALAAISLDAILAVLPKEIPLALAIRLDGRVLAFAALITLGTAVLVGLAPTVIAAKRPPGTAMIGRGSQTKRQRRTAKALLAMEVAQAAALLVCAGLMINTLIRMANARTGFDPEGLVFAHLELPGYSFAADASAGRRAAFLAELRRRLLSLPEVQSVGIGSASPFSGMTFGTGVELEGGTRPGSGNGGLSVAGDQPLVSFSRVRVDDGYFNTLGLPLVAGRGLRPDDFSGSPVALINEIAAHAYWPDESPLGKRMIESGRQGASGAAAQWITIVGVVADFDHPGLPTQGMAEFYVPLPSDALEATVRPSVIVRSSGAAHDAVESVRREIWAIDPDLAIPAVSTATDYLGASLAVPRFYSIVLGAFAILALILAGVGIYGVVAHSVVRRHREIGIRLALGAPSISVGALIVREGMSAVAVGLLVGLFVGVSASRLLAGLLYGVVPADPLTASIVAIVLFVVAGVAIAIPAQRAMRADPVSSLRAD